MVASTAVAVVAAVVISKTELENAHPARTAARNRKPLTGMDFGGAHIQADMSLLQIGFLVRVEKEQFQKSDA